MPKKTQRARNATRKSGSSARGAKRSQAAPQKAAPPKGARRPIAVSKEPHAGENAPIDRAEYLRDGLAALRARLKERRETPNERLDDDQRIAEAPEVDAALERLDEAYRKLFRP